MVCHWHNIHRHAIRRVLVRSVLPGKVEKIDGAVNRDNVMKQRIGRKRFLERQDLEAL